MNIFRARAQVDTAKETEETGKRRDQVPKARLLDTHATAEQNCKIAHFMRQLVEEHGENGAKSRRVRADEGGANGQTVGEIVESVADDNHPAD